MIRGEKVILRALETTDAEQLQAWVNDQEVTYWLGRHTPISLSEEQRWLETERDSAKELQLAISTLNGQLIGSCDLRGLDSPDRGGTIGLWIGDKQFWDGGYGTDTVLTLCGYGFTQTNLHRIQLAVFAGNARAVRCYEKCGFEHEGCRREAIYKHGRYHDLLGMSILAAEYQEKWPERWAAACR
jgi:RimJ/RimL family protein N-acetyltransferase